MKELEFRDLKQIKYKILDDFMEKMKQTEIYRKLGSIDSESLIEHEGEIYEVGLYANSGISTSVTHIHTHTTALSDIDLPDGKNEQIYTTCRWLCFKLLDDWIEETKRNVQQEE